MKNGSNAVMKTSNSQVITWQRLFITVLMMPVIDIGWTIAFICIGLLVGWHTAEKTLSNMYSVHKPHEK